jgi:hypothetical protein
MATFRSCLTAFLLTAVPLPALASPVSAILGPPAAPKIAATAPLSTTKPGQGPLADAIAAGDAQRVFSLGGSPEQALAALLKDKANIGIAIFAEIIAEAPGELTYLAADGKTGFGLFAEGRLVAMALAGPSLGDPPAGTPELGVYEEGRLYAKFDKE